MFTEGKIEQNKVQGICIRKVTTNYKPSAYACALHEQ